MRVYNRKNVKLPSIKEGEHLWDYYRSIHSSHYPLKIKLGGKKISYVDKLTWDEIEAKISNNKSYPYIPTRHENHCPTKEINKDTFDKLCQERNFEDELKGVLK